MKRILIFCIILLGTSFCFGQRRIVYQKVKYNVQSTRSISPYKKSQQDELERENVMFSKLIEIKDAAALRLIFDDYNLGENSKIRIESVADGGTQVFTGKYLDIWKGKSAYFNGDAVKVSLIRLNSDEDAFFSIKEILVGEYKSIGNEGKKSGCADDDERDPDINSAIARVPLQEENPYINGTAFLVNNGAIITAGHVIDENGNNIVDSGVDILEFNVPESSEEGEPVLAHPDDQYPIDKNDIDFVFDDEEYGNDWAILKCGLNANGDLPHESQDTALKVTKISPIYGTTMTISGYGRGGDNDEYYATLKTSEGPYRGEEDIDDEGEYVYHKHDAFCFGGNSGSPISWNYYGLYVIGVHCYKSCYNQNYLGGTSFNNTNFGNALQNFHGPNTTYVDFEQPPAANENGTIYEPYNSIQEGVNAATAGGKLYIVPDTYLWNSGLTINKAITIIPPAYGVVVISP